MNQRFYSLDVFRGATVALMILVNNPGSWSHMYDPLKHATWHGCTPTDLVFPFFLFAVGNAMAFVLPRLEAAGPSVFWQKILKRTFLIFFIGLLLNLFPFVQYNATGELVMKKLANIRFMGVLQRIAICYFVASLLLYYLKAKGAFIASTFLLLAYWFICIAGNPSDPFSLAGWFGTNIDIYLLGSKHLYKGEGIPFDPEGLMSSFAAIVQVVFGYMAGHYILTKGKTPEMLNGLFVAGALLVFTGFVWDMQFPINKKIWTSSYTVYTTGLALLVLSMMIYLIEFNNKKGAWSRFFDVFGKNALFIFVLSGALPRLLALIRIPNGVSESGKNKFLTPFNWIYEKICSPLFNDPRNGSLMYALFFIGLMWLIAWWMDKKKIYIKV
ncbi:MAG: heparan-alpha-glucosaminide N-acetyltransferase domain-containing protein [Ferruginibacter sp.]